MLSEDTHDTLAEIILAEEPISTLALVRMLGRMDDAKAVWKTSRQIIWLQRKGLVVLVKKGPKGASTYIATPAGLEYAASWLGVAAA